MPEGILNAMSDLKSNVSFGGGGGRNNSGGGGNSSGSRPTRQQQINSGARPGLSTTERNQVLAGAGFGALAGGLTGGPFGAIVGGGLGLAAGTAQALMD